MARKPLSKSLISRAEAAAGDETETRRPEAREEGRPLAGAWRAGATAQLRADLDASEGDARARVMEGRAELSLDAAQIDDPLGSDRRPDWRAQEDFLALRASIEANGQDVPVQVTPLDPAWRPDPRAPFETGDTRFALLAGRRRLAALQELGLPVRAVIVPVEGEGDARHATMLTRRWRENAERADLSPFERLLAIGEMFEVTKRADPKATAAQFGERIGVSESVVSRARAVSARREAILAAVPDPYALSNSALYTLLPRLEAPKRPAPKPAAPDPIKRSRKAGAMRVEARMKGTTLTLTARGVKQDFDPAALDALLDEVIRHMEGEGDDTG